MGNYSRYKLVLGIMFGDNEELESKLEADHAGLRAKNLIYISDDLYLNYFKILGMPVLEHSTSEGYETVSEEKILVALAAKEQIAAAISSYGIEVKPEHIRLHQYIMTEG
jgi:hypothetical protein